MPGFEQKKDDDWQIFAFHHPFAGDQFVKGTIEKDENPEIAALRELTEESGITSAKMVRNLGVRETGFENQIWSLFLCEAENLPDEQTFHADDDGGPDFAFFRHSLNADSGKFYLLYQEAVRWIKDKLSIV